MKDMYYNYAYQLILLSDYFQYYIYLYIYTLVYPIEIYKYLLFLAVQDDRKADVY